MFSTRWLLLPFFLQVIGMALDEFYYHRQRGLARWERWGHPCDTYVTLACLLWLLFVPPSWWALGVYVLLTALASLVLVKDEHVHQRDCRAGELRLHAVLFMLHSLVMLSAVILWPSAHRATLPFLRYEGWEPSALRLGSGIIGSFGIYQIVYWNVLWQRMHPPQNTARLHQTTSVGAPPITPELSTTKSITR